MATTVEEGFRTFLSRLTPSSVESQAAVSHRASIEQVLVRDLGMTSFFRTGSFGNGTSIRGHSDVDYFAVIPTAMMNQNSRLQLQILRRTLGNRFPLTPPRIDCPAVILPFGLFSREATEIVPANYFKMSPSNFRVFQIPDGRGLWKLASPDSHNELVRYVDRQVSGKLKPLIRFIKAWKLYSELKISSFYLELLISSHFNQNAEFTYATAVRDVFRFIVSSNFAPFLDPMGISGLVSADDDVVRLTTSLQKAQQALIFSERACMCEAKGNLRMAFVWWNRVFKGKFPAWQ